MPQPTSRQVHTDAILTNISVAYMQKAEHFISWKIFPRVPVSKQRDIYYTYNKAEWFRDEAQRRADGTQSVGSGYGVSTDSYACDVYAFHKDIGPQARANADAPINLERDATNLVTHKLMLKQEKLWVADFFTTSVWTTDKVGGTDFTKWSDYASSDPIEDVEAGKESVLALTGFMPNTLVLGYQVFRKLKHHPDIIDRIKYTLNAATNLVTPDLLAALFELDRVLVAKAISTASIEGASSPTYSFIYGKHALLAYVNPSPSLMAPSAGYTFVWQGVSDGLGADIGTTREEIPLTRGATRVEGQIAWDDKKVAADLGYFFSNAVA